MKIIIGTRGSDLALWQAHHVKDQLLALGQEVEIKIIETKGDRIQDLSFDKIEGKGFFTKEIEEALLSSEVDLAVHSHKDLETVSPDGLMIAAVSPRANPTDTILVRKESVGDGVLGVKLNGTIGTSSARRQSQIRMLRSDLTIKELRGNVPTRINKLRDGNYDAIVLASAGLERLELDLSDLHCVEMDTQEMIPAPAQGVLGLQIRSKDTELLNVLEKMNDKDVAASIGVEREVLRLLEGGCQLPLGAFCSAEADGKYQVSISHAETKDDAAQYYEFTTTDLTIIASEIVSTLQNNG